MSSSSTSSTGVAKVSPIIFTQAASAKAKELITEEENRLNMVEEIEKNFSPQHSNVVKCLKTIDSHDSVESETFHEAKECNFHNSDDCL